MNDLYYRYDDVRYAPSLNEFGEPCGEGRTDVVLRVYRVTKVTPKGVWLDGRKFVRTSARKRFACPTKAEAFESFVARKTRQLHILRSQVKHITTALQIAKDKVSS